MSSIPGVNINFGTHLMSHLGDQVTSLKIPHSFTPSQRQLGLPLNIELDRHSQTYSCIASTVKIPEPAVLNDLNVASNQFHLSSGSPLSDRGYHSGRETSPTPSAGATSPSLSIHSVHQEDKKDGLVWRPFQNSLLDLTLMLYMNIYTSISFLYIPTFYFCFLHVCDK